jgi:hypothetical protein
MATLLSEFPDLSPISIQLSIPSLENLHYLASMTLCVYIYIYIYIYIYKILSVLSRGSQFPKLEMFSASWGSSSR